jgi:hypothetical protein
VRSLRAKRGRFILASAALAAGVLLVVLSADWRDRVVRPGPLTQQHAQLLERTDGLAPNCGACHAVAAENISRWATSLVISRDDQPTQSQLCMNCHAKSIPKSLSIAAHNLPADALERITNSRGAQPVGLTPASSKSLAHGRDVACATCHREHHGAHVDLTAIDNTACQSCHQERFQSFASDHPDFGSWPYERRTRIIFDHASHKGKHFAEKKKAFDCGTCHVNDASGAVEKLASYEKSCASCHDEKIATSIGRGVPLLVLPTLDVDALKKAGRDIGPWPKTATGDFDGRLPAAMKLLLAGDPVAAKAIAKLGPGFEFQDVDATNAEQAAAAADLAVGIKSLLADLSRRGAVAVRERLSAALGREVADAEVATLVGGASADTLRGAAGWVSGVVNPNDAAAAVPPTTSLAHLTGTAGPVGTWSRDDGTFALRYRPAVHSDPVLAGWLELLARTPKLESRASALAMFKELTKTTAPGLCASCHSVEQSERGTLTINWRAYDRANEPRGFTKFSHKPHLVLPQLESCTSCHAIDSGANTAASYTDLNPQRFVSEFKPLDKRQCAECHTKTAAGDDCQSCHNYHVEAVEGWRSSKPTDDPHRQADGRLRPLEFGLPIDETAAQSAIREPQSEIR